MKTEIESLICFLLFLSSAQSFIMSTGKGFSKCFYSEVSPDKVNDPLTQTFDVRFGYARRERENCLFKLTIDYIEDQTDEKNKNLYSGEFHCYELSPREPFVFKHTTREDEYSGRYRVCVENVEDYNDNSRNTMFELQISEKFDPSLILEQSGLPLVESTELMDLETYVLEIKKTLTICQNHLKNTESTGDLVKKEIQTLESFSKKLTFFQIASLVVYGVVWTFLVLKIIR